MRLYRVIAALFVLAVLFTSSKALAHIAISPETVRTGAYEAFTINVPNEKSLPVTQVRLGIPDGVTSVTPTVKAGWDITTKNADGTITEILWSGGSIPSGLQDSFTFSAQVPATEQTLRWPAYQTYQNGDVVSWDQNPDGLGQDEEGVDNGPSPALQVTDYAATASETNNSTQASSATGAYVLAGLGLTLAIIALAKKR